MSVKYTAMWNMPGCLPEMEPAEFDTFEEARDAICEELFRVEEDAGTEDILEPSRRTRERLIAVENAREEVRDAEEPFTVGPVDGYIFSVDKQEG